MEQRPDAVRRLDETVATHGDRSAEALVSAIVAAAEQFARYEWENDVTVVVVKRVSH